MTIRTEQPGDEPAIHHVTEAAFADHPHSEGTEPAIVDALRTSGDLALSLVAEEGGAIVGHVAFSRAILSGGEGGWYTLGPISVLPEQQGEVSAVRWSKTVRRIGARPARKASSCWAIPRSTAASDS